MPPVPPHGLDFEGTQRYQVLRCLGAGGMGIVYEVLDRERGTRAALKTLQKLDAEALFRLKKEFRALQDLQHPGLVSLGELFEEAGTWCLTMELVVGVDFVSHVRGRSATQCRSSAPSTPPGDSGTSFGEAPTRPGPASAPVSRPVTAFRESVDEPRLRDALAQLTRGLMALHAAEKVHRDIKPSNVLVTAKGRVVLLDFGLVTGIAHGRQTTGQELVGSVDYMAPEQAASKPVGPEADWYSMGVMLFEALTGRLPFSGAPLEILMTKQEREPPSPAHLVPDVPPDLAELCVSLLRIAPGARPKGAAILRRLDASAPSVPSLSRAVSAILALPFIGRQRELAGLQAAYQESRRGSAVVVVVEGESGMGKTALVKRFTEALVAEDPTVVILSGRCYEREFVPYKAVDGVVDALSRFLLQLPERDSAAVVPRRAALLGQIFPVLRRVGAIAASPRSRGDVRIDPQELRGRLFGAMRELLGALADRRSLVVTIDDLQWADADSLTLLAEVLRPPDEPALLVVATRRTAGERRNGEGELLGIAHRTLPLERLPPEEALALAEVLLGQEPLGSGASAGTIAEEAHGHPLFIQELVRHAGAGGAEGQGLRLDEALRARIAELPGEARAALELAAVAGVPLPVDVVVRASGATYDEVTRAVARLRSAHLVRSAGVRHADAIEPYHDRIREAVAGALDDERRQKLHLRLAMALETAEHADPQVLAAQWRGAGEPERSVEYAHRAARQAEAALAFDDAARLYRSALEQLPPGSRLEQELNVRLGEALANAGRGAAAAAAFLRAVRTASAAEALELQRRAAEQFLRVGHIDEGVVIIDSVLARVGMRRPRTPRGALAQLLWRRAHLRLRGLRTQVRDETQLSPEELARIDACWSMGIGLGIVDNICGAAYQTKALLLALRAGERSRLARALAADTCFVSTAGRPARARVQQLRRTIDQLKLGDDALTEAWILVSRGICSYYFGEWREALERSEQAEEIFRDRCTGVVWEVDSTQLYGIWALFYLGELGRLERRVVQLLREAEHRGDLFAATNLQTGLASVAWLMRDDPGGARQAARAAIGCWSHQGFHVQHWLAFGTEAFAALYEGEPAAALDEINRQWRPLQASMLLRIQIVRIEALMHRARLSLATAADRERDRPALLAVADRDARRILRERMAWSAPLALLLQAAVASARGRADLALPILARAAEGFDAAEMPLYAAVTRWRWGELAGGDEGKACIESARGLLVTERVTRPERFLAMLAPGFEPR
jgi:serine/threonine protein kinase/tetratricopeptide (TPR) repeat protein